ncbi:MAG: FliO/MopB family protein [Immundisolibacter sp.]|uniref:FliO/MopB family protein n=1 Tax=Immundisolibacter sp. TaxID=1934948 RepID=UPI003D095D15
MRAAALLLFAPLPAIAAVPSGSAALAASGQMLVSLLLVVGLIGGLFVVLKRLQVRGGASGAIRVLAAQSLGTRERAVLVEVAGRQVLVGVAPGRVQTLLVIGEQADAAPFAAALDDARNAQGAA